MVYKNLDIVEPTCGRAGMDLVQPPGLQKVKPWLLVGNSLALSHFLLVGSGNKLESLNSLTKACP